MMSKEGSNRLVFVGMACEVRLWVVFIFSTLLCKDVIIAIVRMFWFSKPGGEGGSQMQIWLLLAGQDAVFHSPGTVKACVLLSKKEMINNFTYFDYCNNILMKRNLHKIMKSQYGICF